MLNYLTDDIEHCIFGGYHNKDDCWIKQLATLPNISFKTIKTYSTSKLVKLYLDVIPCTNVPQTIFSPVCREVCSFNHTILTLDPYKVTKHIYIRLKYICLFSFCCCNWFLFVFIGFLYIFFCFFFLSTENLIKWEFLFFLNNCLFIRDFMPISTFFGHISEVSPHMAKWLTC